jgi:zinc protease
MLAALYQNHPYRRPVLGWAHEIAELDREAAATFYRQHYTASNAILVVAGDVSETEVRRLAETSYGRHPRSPAVATRVRPREPEHVAARRVRLEDARTGEPLLLRYYHVPSLASATKGEAAALAVLARVIGGDDTSRLYRRLVLEDKLAVQAGADYQAANRDSGRFALLVLAAKGQKVQDIERALDEVMAGVVTDDITAEELVRAKRTLEADHVFETDNQEKRARRIGEGLTVGRPLVDIESDQARLQAVTLKDVRAAAKVHLDLRRSVTGILARPGATER